MFAFNSLVRGLILAFADEAGDSAPILIRWSYFQPNSDLLYRRYNAIGEILKLASRRTGRQNDRHKAITNLQRL
ncbi:hypothetical protein F4801DRAFT_538516 [Xylaria longipes]|nr:hypothetical protein F4801DRAFT_538516 [Xylaria longipes]